jgi:hypothetical protein
MGPATTQSPPGSGREALDQAIASPDLVPRNLTGIGRGIIDGAGVLDAERLAVGTPYQRFALCVMTDGNENVPPMVADPAVSTAIVPYADAVYAVGLGQPGGVSDSALTAISNYMLITGDVTAAERRFRLTKYFMQILAGITRTATVVDPQGDLQIGSEHRIPFHLSDHDVEADVVALSPLAPLLEMSLEAPDGTVIDAGFGGPAVEFHQQLDDAFYRLALPVSPGVPRAGRWTAVLRLTKEAVAKVRDDDRPAWRERIRQLAATGTLPYSLVVQSWSNLRLDVAVTPALCRVGDTVELTAALTAFEQPYLDPARVVALVTDPQGVLTRTPLTGLGGGRFGGALTANDAGLHEVRFVASGGQGRRNRFTREETRTATAYRGEIPDGKGSPDDDKVRTDRGGARRRIGAVPEGSEMSAPDEKASDPVREMPENLGLTEQPPATAREPEAAGPHTGEHDHRHDHGHDHEAMVFSMFKRTPDGGIVEILPQDIERDTSGYDEDGNDPGQGSAGLAGPDRGPGGHDH